MPLQVLHFRDEESQHTYNYLGNNSVTAETLMATVVLYLSNVTRGGEILFPESEVRMQWPRVIICRSLVVAL